MKITTERKPDSQILLEIEVDPERLQKSMDQAYKRMVGKYRIPGFRPGKAPRVMFERFVGRETLLREALERLVPEVYDEAIKEQSLDPIDQPEFEIPEVEPLRIKATVPLRPIPDLKDYRSLRVERAETPFDAQEVEKNIEDLRQRYATLEPVERPVQAGDVVRADLSARVDDRELLNETDADLRLTEEGMQGLPGLFESLTGTQKGQDYDFECEVPEDNADTSVAGKTISYHVAIKEVKEEKLPEPTDEFAKEVGEGFESYEALRQRVEEDVRKRVEDAADREYEQKVLDSLIEQANLEYPPVLVEREIQHIVSEQTGGGSRANLDAALRSAGRTEAEYREELRPFGKQRVERSLVLTELARREGIEVQPDEIEAELERLAGPNTTQNARMRELFDTPTGREFIERTLLTRRVYERLRDIGQGKELPPPADVPETAAPLVPFAEGTQQADPLTEAMPTAESAESANQAGEVSGSDAIARLNEPEADVTPGGDQSATNGRDELTAVEDTNTGEEAVRTAQTDE